MESFRASRQEASVEDSRQPVQKKVRDQELRVVFLCDFCIAFISPSSVFLSFPGIYLEHLTVLLGCLHSLAQLFRALRNVLSVAPLFGTMLPELFWMWSAFVATFLKPLSNVFRNLQSAQKVTSVKPSSRPRVHDRPMALQF